MWVVPSGASQDKRRFKGKLHFIPHCLHSSLERSPTVIDAAASAVAVDAAASFLH